MYTQVNSEKIRISCIAWYLLDHRINASILLGWANFCGRDILKVIKLIQVICTRNLTNSIGCLCKQDLELTPPILPDRANFCGRGHPKIDLFHTNILFLLKYLFFYFLSNEEVFVNALKLFVMAKSYGKIKSKCFKVMIAYISYDIKICEKSCNFSMSYQPKCKRTKAECFKL